MPTIKTNVDQETYGKLLEKAKQEGLLSISALFLKYAGMSTDQAESEVILRRALAKAKSKESGETFLVRDLFPAVRWRAFSTGARLRAGRRFHAKVAAAGDALEIAIGPKTASNHQTYVRR